MNALTTIPTAAIALVIPQDATIDDWWTQGESLFTQRRQIDWMLADWVSGGVQKFGEQVCFDFAADRLAIEPKQLRNSAKVASAFPPSMRAADVPFEVHAYLAQLPEDRRLETLQRASTEHWGAKKAREIVTAHRQQSAMFEDEDPERLATLIYRAWNNATPDVREIAFTLIQAAADRGFTLIDEEALIDA